VGIVDDARAFLSKALTGAAGAVQSGDEEEDISFEQMQDALAGSGLAEPTDEKPRALFHDPYSVMDWGGWRERPSVLTYDSLRMMAQKNTVIAACIQVRTNQVAQFARPQQGRYDKGYKIVLRDRRDKRRMMSKIEASQAAEIERMLETTGLLREDEKASDRDSFKDFLKKGVRDIIIYDQWCWEKIRDRVGRPSRFIALPSETIRPAVADIEHMDPAEMRNRVSHVQVYEDTVIAEFSPDDIAWCIMNPRSDIRSNGFGFSAIEQLTNIVTSWLYGLDYNTRFFTQGSAIKGVLNVKGAIPDRQLKAFRRMWYAMVGGGVQNAWRTPILNSDDIQFVPMHSTNREMEFANWMDFLTKLITAVLGMDPMEINFIFGNTGVSSGLNQSRPNQEEVSESKDKGLRPLMEHIADSLNQHLIWEINPDFEFQFVGLDAKAEEVERQAHISEVTNFKTVNQILRERDEEPMGPEGDVILNPTWVQWAQAQQQGGEGGPLGGDGGPMSELGDEDEDDDDAFGGGDFADGDEGSPDDGSFNPDPVMGKSLALLWETERFVDEELKKAHVSRKVKGDRQIIDITLPGGD